MPNQTELIANIVESLAEAAGTRIQISGDFRYLHVWSEDGTIATKYQLPSDIDTYEFLERLEAFMWIAVESGGVSRVQVLKSKGLLN